MRIAMFTNTYLPHIGGVARSVSDFAAKLRQWGHEVLVVAPTFHGGPAPDEAKVLRVPAIQNFNGSDFSVRLPLPGLLRHRLDAFRPQLIHAHHPFLLGDTALRAAIGRELPLLFTHHTLYECYTHYVPIDSPAIRRFVRRLATEYANLCDHVIAPSDSIAVMLQQRGVVRPLSIIPTGIEPGRIQGGSGMAVRQRQGIPAEAFVLGHIGRLAPEKNLTFLARSAARFLQAHPAAHLLIGGEGPERVRIIEAMVAAGVQARLHLLGRLGGRELADAYAAMDLFAFSSQSETQGMVLSEAMTAGLPVVALDARGAREIVHDGRNGRLLPANADEAAFAAVLGQVAGMAPAARQRLASRAGHTAEAFTLDCTTRQLVDVYERLVQRDWRLLRREQGGWLQARRLLETEWTLWSRRAGAAVDAITHPDSE